MSRKFTTDVVILCPIGDLTNRHSFWRDGWRILLKQLERVGVDTSELRCDADGQTLSAQQLNQLADDVETYLASSLRGPGGFRVWITGMPDTFRELARQGGAKVFTSDNAYESARIA